ncbi:hypothetical protein D3C71_1851630 [compost metagenome]
MATALLQHRLHGVLRRVEEARQVRGKHVSVLLFGIGGKGVGDENAGVVHQRVHPAEAVQRLFHDSLARGGVTDIPGDGQVVGIVRRLD